MPVLVVLFVFAAGIAAGYFKQGIFAGSGSLSTYVLYFLLFFIGIEIGMKNRGKGLIRIAAVLKKSASLIAGTVFGTLAGGLAAGILCRVSLRESLAIASGFGWYSLSSVLLTNLSGASVGAVALVSNIFRETIAIILIPALGRKGLYDEAISVAGATSMDTTLPIITSCGGEAETAFLHGLVLSILVPVFITAIYAVF